MKLRRPDTEKYGGKRAAAFMLAALMTLLIVFPSFAENDTVTEEPQGADSSIITEEVNTEDDEYTEETDAGDVQEETGEDPEDEAAGDEDSASVVEDTEESEPEEAPLRSEKPVLLKAAAGQRVSYTGKRVGSNAGETTVFTVSTGGTTYTGACAEQGVAMRSSGHATITRISNGSKIAKVIYHYAIALGDQNWWTSSHKTDKVGKIIGMANAGDTDVTKRRMIEVFCQIHYMGSSDWYNTVTSSSGGGWSTNTARKVRDYYSNINISNITVPEGFEIWLAKSENKAQSFVMWAYNPVGYVTMKKTSANAAISG